ncbi:MAG: 3,4-dehydroadipyl-CoA semialdehyde dehydrogenase [Xanthobacteraceae bacterium]|nr:MAG: 3,4-dehydroadipyl-CoA semialdehyde dehydrogenase [Xanthobacteraceae bacterium]
MIRLESYLSGVWQPGKGEGRAFVDPTTGAALGTVDSSGLDIAGAVAHARARGTALRAMSFAERGALLNAIADVLVANKADYADIARRNSGNTARDAAIDIDGGIGTLKYYARLGRTLGAGRALIEPGEDQLAKAETFKARHIWTARPGVAIHINAFNFPSWGLWEKVAVAFLAGSPVVAKPASATAWLSERMVRDVVAANILPAGALSLVCGAGEGLLDAVDRFDAIAFTGSADTGAMIRGHARVMERAPRLNIEADSINVAVLGNSAAVGGDVFNLLLREVTNALSVKAGQLCTNIRRILVPRDKMAGFVEALVAKVDGIAVGDPALAETRLGPLCNDGQRKAALAGLARLTAEARPARGGDVPASVNGADAKKGAFLAPTLLVAPSGQNLSAVHDVEVFGPAATVIPYGSDDEAVALALRGEGSLAASLWVDEAAEAARLAAGLAPLHGRVLCVDPVVGASHTGHPIVMPQCIHGGPGRAGGGEELGGLRGLRFYSQRTALQGSPAMLEAVAGQAAVAAL